jgi:protein O-mannosyl-transferase
VKKEQLKKGPAVKVHIKKQLKVKRKVIPDKYFNLAGLAVIVLLGIIIYSNSFGCAFHFDDFLDIVNNTKIQNLSDIKAWWNYVPSRPIGNFTFALNYHFNQLDVWYYHLVNLVIHLINSCLVWRLTLLILSAPALKDQPVVKHKAVFAFLTALLFVSHPLATQSVTYIVQRLASLVAMFYLLSLVLYMNARLAKSGTTSKYLLFAGSFLAAILAMFTKENSFTLPFAVILCEIFFLRTKAFSINFKDWRVIFLTALFLGIIIIVPLKFSFSVFRPISPEQGHEYTITPLNYLLTQFTVILKYIQLLILPVNQNLDYDFSISNSFLEVRTLISFVVLSMVFIIGIYLFRKHRMMSFGIFWFFLTLSVESSIIPIPNVIFEHRTYLPSFGYFIVLSSVLFIFWDKFKYLVLAVLVIIIGSNSLLTFERNKVWKDELSLWSDCVAKSPNSARSLANVGKAKSVMGDIAGGLADYDKAIMLAPQYSVAYFNRGVSRALVKDYQGALNDYDMAMKYNVPNITIFVNRGNVKSALNNNKGALEDYKKAVKLDPANPDIYFNCAIAEQNLGDYHGAISYLDTALGLRSNFPQAYIKKGIIKEIINDRNGAIENFSLAIKTDPGSTDGYKNRGLLYLKQGKYSDALTDFNKALEIKPDLAEVWFLKAELYVQINNPQEAIGNYAKATELNPGYYDAWVEKAMAENTIKDYPAAIRDFSSAIAINPQSADAYRNRGTMKFYLKDMKGACLDWKKAAELGNRDVVQLLQLYCK